MLRYPIRRPASGRPLTGIVAAAGLLLISGAFGFDTGFPSGTNFPTKKEALSTLTDPKARTLMAAVFDGDERVVRQMLDADPGLASTTALRPDFANTYIGLLNAAIAPRTSAWSTCCSRNMSLPISRKSLHQSG